MAIVTVTSASNTTIAGGAATSALRPVSYNVHRAFRSNYSLNDAKRQAIANLLGEFNSSNILIAHWSGANWQQVDFAPTTVAGSKVYRGTANNAQGLDELIALVGGGTPSYDATRTKGDIEFLRLSNAGHASAKIMLVMQNHPQAMMPSGWTVQADSGSRAWPRRENWGSIGAGPLALGIWNRYTGMIEGFSYGQEMKNVSDSQRQALFPGGTLVGGGTSVTGTPFSVNNLIDWIEGYNYFAQYARANMPGAKLWMAHIDITNRASTAENQALIDGGNSMGSQPDQIYDEIFWRLGRIPGTSTFPAVGTFDASLLPDRITIDCSISSGSRWPSYAEQAARTKLEYHTIRVLKQKMAARGLDIPVVPIESYNNWDQAPAGITFSADQQAAITNGLLYGDLLAGAAEAARWEPQGGDLSGSPTFPNRYKSWQSWWSPYDPAGFTVASPNVYDYRTRRIARDLSNAFPPGTALVVSTSNDANILCVASATTIALQNLSAAAISVTVNAPGGSLAPISVPAYDQVIATLPAALPSSARDAFARTLAGSWGSADVGGPWSITGGVVGDYNVSGGAGTISNLANEVRTALLDSVSALDVTGTFRVRVDKIPAPTTQNTQPQIWVRRDAATISNYRFKVAVYGTGAPTLQIGRQTNGLTEVQLTAPIFIAAAPSLAINTDLWVRFYCANLAPNVATIRMRAWLGLLTDEPAAWDINITDSTLANQVAGDIEFFIFTSAVTNGPIVHSFDDLNMDSPFAFSGADTATGSDSSVLTIGPVSVTASDTASGTDTATKPAVTHARSETGAGVDVAAQSQAIAATDTGAGVDASGDRTTTPAADTAVATDGRAPFNSVPLDTFRRTVAAGWGTADNGVAWTPGGTTAARSAVDAGVATITSTAVQTNRWLLPISELDFDIVVPFSRDKLAVGGAFTYYVVGRQVGIDGNGYRLAIVCNTDQTIDLAIETYLASVGASIASATNVETDAAGIGYYARFRGLGTNPTMLAAKVWRQSDLEPPWDVSALDSTAAIQVAGGRGIRTFTANGTTNVPVVASFTALPYTPVPEATLTPTDIGTGAEASSESASLTATDTGSGSEPAANLNTGSSLAATDQGVGLDSVVSLITDASFIVSDSAVGADAVASLQTDASFAGAETSAGADSSVLTTSNEGTDTGAADDAAVLDVAHTGTDESTGDDAASLEAAATGTDTGALSDGASLTVYLDLTDDAVSDDELASFALEFTLEETGTGVDSAVLSNGTGRAAIAVRKTAGVAVMVRTTATVTVEVARE